MVSKRLDSATSTALLAVAAVLVVVALSRVGPLVKAAVLGWVVAP